MVKEKRFERASAVLNGSYDIVKKQLKHNYHASKVIGIELENDNVTDILNNFSNDFIDEQKKLWGCINTKRCRLNKMIRLLRKNKFKIVFGTLTFADEGNRCDPFGTEEIALNFLNSVKEFAGYSLTQAIDENGNIHYHYLAYLDKNFDYEKNSKYVKRRFGNIHREVKALDLDAIRDYEKNYGYSLAYLVEDKFISSKVSYFIKNNILPSLIYGYRIKTKYPKHYEQLVLEEKFHKKTSFETTETYEASDKYFGNKDEDEMIDEYNSPSSKTLDSNSSLDNITFTKHRFINIIHRIKNFITKNISKLVYST